MRDFFKMLIVSLGGEKLLRLAIAIAAIAAAALLILGSEVAAEWISERW